MGKDDELRRPTFRASREGLAQVLGALEAEIMEYVWGTAAGPVPAREVAERVGGGRGVSYITVVTVMNNLCRKGLLRRERHGRAYHYAPRLSRDRFLGRVSRQVLAGMIRLSPEVAVNSFVDVLTELSPEALGRLQRALEEKRREERER
jgi:predicted transcriptional regulator